MEVEPKDEERPERPTANHNAQALFGILFKLIIKHILHPRLITLAIYT